MRVVFFGTPDFAVPTLAALHASSHRVVGVVTQPDRPRGRGQRLVDAPVKAFARAHDLPVLQPARLAHELFADSFSALEAELGVVAAYGKILPAWLLAAPRLGMINVHASLLPRFRGAAPVHRAVIAGDTQTGVTIMRVVQALDAGPMIAHAVRPIGHEDSSDEVERDLATLGAQLLVKVVDALASGLVTETTQDETLATYAPRLTKDEGRLDFAENALTVHNRIRGLRPWPGAFTFRGEARLAIHKARVSPRPSRHAAPGTCTLTADGAVDVVCGDQVGIELLLVQPEGKRVMTTREYLAGHGAIDGTRLG